MIMDSRIPTMVERSTPGSARGEETLIMVLRLCRTKAKVRFGNKNESGDKNERGRENDDDHDGEDFE